MYVATPIPATARTAEAILSARSLGIPLKLPVARAGFRRGGELAVASINGRQGGLDAGGGLGPPDRPGVVALGAEAEGGGRPGGPEGVPDLAGAAPPTGMAQGI